MLYNGAGVAPVMSVVNDKRNHKRFKLNVLEVNGTIMFTKNVKVIDISMNGVSLESTNRLNLGNSYRLRLTDRKKDLSLTGNVVWSSLIESRRGSSGNVIPIYKVGMNFIDMSPEKEIEFLNFILENQKTCVYKATVAMPESGLETPREFLDEAGHRNDFRGSIGYHKAPGIIEHPGGERIKEAYQAATTGEVSLTRLIVPRKVLATTGKALTLNAHAVAASKAGEVPVTITLTAIPAAGVRVGIHPANITKDVDRHTNFCFSSKIVCAKSGMWPVKWSAKISSSNGSCTESDILTGITTVVCRNAWTGR